MNERKKNTHFFSYYIKSMTFHFRNQIFADQISTAAYHSFQIIFRFWRIIATFDDVFHGFFFMNRKCIHTTCLIFDNNIFSLCQSGISIFITTFCVFLWRLYYDEQIHDYSFVFSFEKFPFNKITRAHNMIRLANARNE